MRNSDTRCGSVYSGHAASLAALHERMTRFAGPHRVDRAPRCSTGRDSWRRGALQCLLLSSLACQPSAIAPATTRAAPPPPFLITDLVGSWRWLLRTQEAGTTRVESETWRFRPAPGAPTQLAGRYVRDVEVRSDDRVPFGCNQRTWYRQRATYDFVLEPTAAGLSVRETDYHTEPSPCDHGFRHLGAYVGIPAGERLTLRWDGGSQTLWQIDNALEELPGDPWPKAPEILGAWRWDATSYDSAGNLRDETERWELVRRTDTQLDATYRRHVMVRSPDGAPMACANADSWSFDDAYVLSGQREEEHWHFYELGGDAGTHPCLQATPRRSLDEATAEQLGDYLVLEWRGKRRQVLYRPD